MLDEIIGDGKIVVSGIISIIIATVLSGFPGFITAMIFETVWQTYPNEHSIIRTLVIIYLLLAILLACAFYVFVKRPTFKPNNIAIIFGIFAVLEYEFISWAMILMILGPVGWFHANTIRTVTTFLVGDGFGCLAVTLFTISLMIWAKKRYGRVI
jgi:hypothetical protein